MQLSCPTADRLREFLEGSVDDAEANHISGHVVECPSCDRVLVTLESEQNDVLKTLREGVGTESLLQEPEFEQLRNTARFSQADTIAPADVDELPETGKRLRDYRLVKKIGEGGMGTVYHAFHVHLAKHVALKILPSDKLRSKQLVARFRQEMRAVGKVNHPNVVSASDAGTIDGQHFLVMELVQGADLARIIHDRGPLKVADACEIVRQAAIGLQHAHDNELVHRDVKPSNIMLALDGSVKLLDLGLAGLNNTEFESTANVVVTDRLTSVGQIMGTLDYMAPEQITASPRVDGKADIYALGATLFQLLTGRTPCGDRSEGTPERIEAVLHKPPLAIATLRNDVPEELQALLLRMLAKNPEDRPLAAIDVAGELVRFTSDADLAALAEECRTSLDMPSADVDVTDDVSFVISRNTQTQDEGNSRTPFRAVALASFFLALVAAVVYYIQTNNGVVLVEVNDPSLKVAINDQTITMNEGNKKPLTIRAGEQSLVVRQGDSGLEFETDRFQIRRGDKIAFKVERLDGEVVIKRNGERFGGVKLPNDRQEIQGVWQVVSSRQDDVVNVGMDASLTVDGHAFSLSFRGPNGAIVDERSGQIEIDVTRNPKTIDFSDSKENGEDLIGIYKLEGDILTICVGEVHESERPRDFKWPQGPGIMRMECQRRKSAAGSMDIHTPGVREAALRTSSHNNMKHITFALLDYYKANQQWPDKLDTLLPLLEVGKSVFENPLTGDNPGYDYVKPTAPLEKITAAETVVLYQLRDGQRDRQLACAFLDGQASLSKDSGKTEAEHEPPEHAGLAVPGSSYGAVYWEPDGPKMIFAPPQERFDSEELIKSAQQSGKDGDLKAATDAYLKALSLDPYLLSGNVVALFQQANRLSELGECIDETGLKRRIYEDSLSREAIKALLNDEKTRDLGLRVLRNYFRIYHRGRHNVLTSPEDHGIIWKDVPDLIYFLRVLLIPTDFEQEGEGWGRYSVLSCGDRGEGRGPLTDASVLFFDKDVLRTFTNEVRALTKENPGWKGGLVLLATLEAELGNFDTSVAIINEHFIGPTEPVIPVSTAWVLGLALEGKNHDLDQFVIRLYEYSLRKIVSNFDDPHLLPDPLRVSPLNELTQLYAKYGRKEEARQLLYGLVDASDQHPLVQGYTPSVFHICNYGPSRSCIDCHRTEMNLPDYVLMSDVMTDIGYPVDSLISLARIDASFGNAFTSSDGWIEQDSGKGKRLYELAQEAEVPTAKYGLPLQKRRAEQAVTPRSVIDALQLGTFETKRRYSQKTYDRIRRRDFRSAVDFRFWARTIKLEEKPSYAIDLMLSVRGEGPDAKATVFSPVIDVLKLAADFEGQNAAKEIADLNARLRLLSEVNSKDIQVLVASTVFAFLRKDLENAQKRLEALKDLKLSSKKDAQRANATLWLAARYALQYEQTRAVGAVLAERSLAAAKALPGTRLKEAILRERTGAGLGKILERRPDLREKLAQKAEERGDSELAEWIRERLAVNRPLHRKVVSPEDRERAAESLKAASASVKKHDWAAATDAYLVAYNANPDTFKKDHIAAFQKANRMRELGQCFDEAAFRAMDYFNDSTYLLEAILDDPQTRPLGFELLKAVFKGKPSKRSALLSNPAYYPFKWTEVPDPIFFLRTVFIPTDFEKEDAGWGRFSIHATNDETGAASGRLTDMKPLYYDRKVLLQFAQDVRSLIDKHQTWDGGFALLSFLEAETGNYRHAAELVREKFLESNAKTIPAHAAWMLGLALEGKDEDLDQVVIQLYERSLKEFASQTFTRPAGSTGPLKKTPLRQSPLSKLARLYAKYGRNAEARRLLYGLVDPNDQHPLVHGYTPGIYSRCYYRGRCNACHQKEMNLFGFTVMSDAMTDSGYPVDSLLSLARIDASFGNAFSSPSGWIDTSADEGRELDELATRDNAFKKQKAKAEESVTPRLIIEALELNTFQRWSRVDQRSYDAILDLMKSQKGDEERTAALRDLVRELQTRKEDKPVGDLMLSVRGEGPDAQATVFSPVIDILELAVNSNEISTAKDIAELDARLVDLSEQHPESIEAGIVATVFAFLRNDLDSAKDRLKRLQAITDYPESDGVAFWLAARHALQYAQTRIIGAVLAERALAAASAQPDSRLKDAIVRERSGAGLRKRLKRSPHLREKLAQEAEESGNLELAKWIRSDLSVDDGQDSLALADRLAEAEDWMAATDAYLSAYRSDPNLFNSSSAYKHVQVFKKAGRLTELANFFDQGRVHRMGHHNGLDRLVMACRTKQETRAAGYELLKRIFNNPPYSNDWTATSNLILRSIRWSRVPDPVFYLRCVLLPTDFEQPGWQRLSVTSASYNQYGVDGYLTLARPLYHDREALRQFATEIRELIEKHPKWVGGWALLAFIEAESGNTRAAVDVLRKRFLDADSDEIPPSVAWLLGECLAGKDDELNRVVIELLEPVVRKIATLTYKRPAGTHGPTGPKSLRLSPIKTLAGLYAKYGRELEARQLLYGLVDSTNQHPLVEGYAGNTMGTTLSCTGQRCLACHQVERGESNFPSYYDFTELSGAMTDIGYPVDSLIALARMDKSYGNAFDSAKGWLDDRPQWAGYLMFKIEHGYFEEQQSKAERRVTPGAVLEALELDTFQRSSRVDGKVVLDLMLSVRGEGPDAKATVFSPVVDILKLAAESKGTDAAKDIAELDKRLVALSEQHPKSIEAGIAATVFAFLRNDLESAKDRLKRLQAITDYPKSEGAAFWLAACHALQHDQTRILGAVLAERALTAAETQLDSGLKEAILHEQSGIRTK